MSLRAKTGPQCSTSGIIIITYFALEQLIVGNNQLFFLCCFGNILDVSQQLVLIEELKGKVEKKKEGKPWELNLFIQLLRHFLILATANISHSKQAAISDEITSCGAHATSATLFFVLVSLCIAAHGA